MDTQPQVEVPDETYEQLLLKDALGVILVCLSCDEKAA